MSLALLFHYLMLNMFRMLIHVNVCWCYVVVWLWWCGICMQAEVLVPQPHRTRLIQPMK